MLALEDLVDLSAALRDAGLKPSTQQTFAAQQLLLRLAADAALPKSRAELASYFGPIYCTSALEQDGFGPLFRRWLSQRFPQDAVAEPEPPPALVPPPQPRPRRWALALVAAVALGAAWYAWTHWPSPHEGPAGAGPAEAASAAASASTAASAGESGSGGGPLPTELPRLVAQFDVSTLLPPPTWSERIHWPYLALAALPLLLFAVWQGMRLARRPVLQRLASRTPPRLREVFLPGGIRLLLPTFPLRRLAQELRRRRSVDSAELQVEPTIAATLRAGGVFSPVRGSRVEPEYLALIDRATLSDHQAQLCAELVSELARADVLIERFDFTRDATVCRPRPALAAHPAGAHSTSARATQTRHAVELVELHERHPEHRVLLFGDGSGCFDGFTGEPAPWLGTLLLWAMPVLLTPVPVQRWARREWALQRLGVQVLPLSRAGLLTLVQVVASGRAEATGPTAPHAPELPLHERTTRRWLERDPPPAETISRLCDELRAELGPRGWAWVCACAAYPEIHWGITLRLGAGLVGSAAEIEALLPRIARLVWFREAYMPDWLRDALLKRLDPADEAHARELLRAMLEGLAAKAAGDIPLRIALGEPSVEPAWWRRAWNAARERSLRVRARQLLRTAPPDSPLRDHVFLRFLSGHTNRRLDLTAPGALLQLLRAGPVAIPGKALVVALSATALLAWVFPPWTSDSGIFALQDLAFAGDGKSAGFVVGRRNLASGGSGVSQELKDGLARIVSSGSGWTLTPQVFSEPWMAVGTASGRAAVRAADELLIVTPGQPSVALTLTPQFQNIDGVEFSEDGRRVAVRNGDAIGVWDIDSRELLRTLDASERGDAVSDVALDPTGTRVASQTTSRTTVKLWSVDGAEPGVNLASGTLGGSLRFSPDGKRLAQVANGNVQRVWDVSAGVLALSGPSRGVGRARRITFSPDFSVAAYLYDDELVLAPALGAGTPRSLPLVPVAGEGLELAFSPDSRLLVSMTSTGSARLWQVGSGDAWGPPLADVPVDTTRPMTIAFSRDARSLAIGSGANLSVWSIPALSQDGPEAAPTPAQTPGPATKEPPPVLRTTLTSARELLLGQYPALRDKALVLTGLRIQHGWIVDAVTPIFAELSADGTPGREYEGVRAGGTGGGTALARRPGYAISGFEVQRGQWENMRTVMSLQVTWKRLPGAAPDAKTDTVSQRFGLAKGGVVIGPPKRQNAAAGAYVGDLAMSEVRTTGGGVYLADLDLRDSITLSPPQQTAAQAVGPGQAPYPQAAQAFVTDGQTVGSVSFGDGGGNTLGYLRRTDGRQWIETGPDGTDVRFRFEETARDESSVTLVDASRNVRLRLDLPNRKVMYADGKQPYRVQYTIVTAR